MLEFFRTSDCHENNSRSGPVIQPHSVACRCARSRPSLDQQRELGQFPTPAPLADFMASMFTGAWPSVRLLDAGAGVGSLSAALIRRLCAQERKPKDIEVVAYEVDPSLTPALRVNLDRSARVCATAGIRFAAEVHQQDFINAAVALTRGDLFAPHARSSNAAIVNPPYRKIRSDSPHRLLLRSAGVETTNLYTGFLSLILRLLEDGGQMVAITPRSFCNGPYFRPFRENLLARMALHRIHVFASRSAAFSADDVLQENIIFHATKSRQIPATVTISTSTGEPGSPVQHHPVRFSQVVSPSDPERFIHLLTDHSQAKVKQAVNQFRATLADLGLSVSTGRVVDFRAASFLREQPAPGTVPLIYPCHFNGGFVHWPKANSRKPNAIVANEQTASLLIPAATYVLVKRFTSKEERRRIVACIFDPAQLPPSATVGFENHLNYFHAHGRGLPLALARGLALFLNSTLVDQYFRQFNGHTQVNATDLRNLRYPTSEQLLGLARRVAQLQPEQEALDLVIEEELHVRC
jgi:adenine-specific DNA-methyltransferase